MLHDIAGGRVSISKLSSRRIRTSVELSSQNDREYGVSGMKPAQMNEYDDKM